MGGFLQDWRRVLGGHPPYAVVPDRGDVHQPRIARPGRSRAQPFCVVCTATICEAAAAIFFSCSSEDRSEHTSEMTVVAFRLTAASSDSVVSPMDVPESSASSASHPDLSSGGPPSSSSHAATALMPVVVAVADRTVLAVTM